MKISVTPAKCHFKCQTRSNLHSLSMHGLHANSVSGIPRRLPATLCTTHLQRCLRPTLSVFLIDLTSAALFVLRLVHLGRIRFSAYCDFWWRRLGGRFHWVLMQNLPLYRRTSTLEVWYSSGPSYVEPSGVDCRDVSPWTSISGSCNARVSYRAIVARVHPSVSRGLALAIVFLLLSLCDSLVRSRV